MMFDLLVFLLILWLAGPILAGILSLFVAGFLWLSAALRG